jgi:hypothetical protein
MKTSGHGNDASMILMPVGVLLVVMMILFGGPSEALEAINGFVRDLVHGAAAYVSSLV